jgi:hypothetical protein
MRLVLTLSLASRSDASMVLGFRGLLEPEALA